MATKTTWIVVADGARAHFYTSDGKAFIPALDHDLAAATRSPAHEVLSDRPGRSFDSAGEGHHAMEPPTDWKTHEKTLLAAAVAGELRQAAARHAFDRVIMVAPPEMLGHLRGALDSGIKRMVEAEIGKDLTHLTAAELRRQLGTALVSPSGA